MTRLKRIRINVCGIVHGVGFRLTVYRYATQFNLFGFAANTPHGVTLEVEGSEDSIDSFVRELRDKPPALATITDFEIIDVEPKNENSFMIL